jgi:hypothetical protein
MTSAAAAPKLETHPPLARDAAGNLVAIPEGTAAWRLCRETAGRPREVRGPDKQPVRFPLYASSDDIADLCGPGVYRVYALDALGEQLADEHIAKWDLTFGREPRNAAADPMVVLRSPMVAPGASAAQTDLRFALEAMAQMMRTNTDALRLVAESQVDLAKAIVTAKGLPRNVAFPALATAPANQSTGEVDDDGEDVEPPVSRPTNVYDLLMPFSEKAAELAPMFLGIGGPGQAGAAPIVTTDAGAATTSAAVDLASRPFEMRELVDLDYAHRKGAAKRDHASAADVRASIQRRIMADPQLVQQVMAIKSALGSDEINELIAAAASWPVAQQDELLARIKPLSTEQAVLFCRETLNQIRAQQQPTED